MPGAIHLHLARPNSVNSIFRRWYTVLIKRKLDLQRQVEALEQENAQLRARLATAQNAKLVAENQADELRKEKERLRVKAAASKKATEQQERVTEQVRDKLAALKEENEKLGAQLTRRRK
jgi:hypothetical protein